MDEKRKKTTLDTVRSVCLALLIIFSGALQVDTCGILGYTSCDGRTPSQAAGTRAHTGLSDDARDFLLKQYETAATEIQNRLDQESVLFAFKFSLVGAILAFLFSFFMKEVSKDHNEKAEGSAVSKGNNKTTQGNAAPKNNNETNQGSAAPKGSSAATEGSMLSTPIAAGICWAAVVTSAVIDCRIEFHSNVMITIGTWIKDNVEPFLLAGQGMPTGYETYLASESTLFRARIYPFLRLNANLLTFLLYTATTLFFFIYLKISRAPFGMRRITRRVCMAGSFFSVVVFFLVSIQMSFQNGAALFISFLLFAVAFISAFLTWYPLKEPKGGGKGAPTNVQSTPT